MTNSAPSAAGKGDLTQGSIRSHLVRLSVPMIWGIMALISFQLVDTFFVARLGTEKLAALTFTFPLSYIIFSFILGFGISMSSVAARLIDRGRKSTCRQAGGDTRPPDRLSGGQPFNSPWLSSHGIHFYSDGRRRRHARKNS